VTAAAVSAVLEPAAGPLIVLALAAMTIRRRTALCVD